jgi:photosystem II stability/assembly factor-like uncharacterized protein
MTPRTLVRGIVLLGALLVLGGCAASPPAAPPTAAAEHIHELAFDPADDAVLVATHTGIFRLDVRSEAVEGPVGGLTFDAMGLTVAGGTAYLSGHPGPATPAEFAGPNLGLLKSTDGARSWSQVALAGEADFHSLAVSAARPSRVFGLAGEMLHRSDDGGATWQQVSTLLARDLLTSEGSPVLYATTAEGLVVSSDDGATFAAVLGVPPLYLIAEGAVPDGRLVGVDVSGIIWYQEEQGGPWLEGGSVEGDPAALMVMSASGDIIVADQRGVVLSVDMGQSWSVLWAAP